MLQGLKISYRNKNYRVQNSNGWKHIIVTEKGNKKRVGLNQIKKEDEKDCVYNYIFGANNFSRYPCPAMEYWIYRHRLGNRISVKDYAIKFQVKKKP